MEHIECVCVHVYIHVYNYYIYICVYMHFFLPIILYADYISTRLIS